jgi:hypothetical protein
MPQHGTALDALIGSADRRLYETKVRRRAAGVRAAAETLAELELTAPDAHDFIA